jgi:hypothetical protein
MVCLMGCKNLKTVSPKAEWPLCQLEVRLEDCSHLDLPYGRKKRE